MIKRFLKTACSLFLAASACLCVSAAFEKTVTYAEGTFKDIPSGAWYAQEVKNTYELGLMNGTGGGLFAPPLAGHRRHLAFGRCCRASIRPLLFNLYQSSAKTLSLLNFLLIF